MPSGRIPVAVVILLVLFGTAMSVRGAGTPAMEEYPLATEGHRPQAITTGPDGNLWVTEVLKHEILRVTPQGQITEFAIPGEGVGVIQGIAAGPDGNIWFTSREENAVRRVSVKGEFNGSFKIPSTGDANGPAKGSWPREMTPAPDGNLYFAEMAANKIARITMKGEITEYPLPTAAAKPYCVIVGPDKQIWFTESGVDKIGRLDIATGKISEFAGPKAKSMPREITVGSDGNFWFTENNADQIGKMTPDGKVSEFPLAKGCQPVGITTGKDGNVYFCEFRANKVGRITPEGKIAEFEIATPHAQPFCLTSGPDGNIWVSLQANRIAKLTIAKP